MVRLLTDYYDGPLSVIHSLTDCHSLCTLLLLHVFSIMYSDTVNDFVTALQWLLQGTADIEIKVPFAENPKVLKVLSTEAWSKI